MDGWEFELFVVFLAEGWKWVPTGLERNDDRSDFLRLAGRSKVLPRVEIEVNSNGR